MQNYSFSGMTLTEIFQIQSLQSIFIKFWYLGLTSENITAVEDTALKLIRKEITFANCYGFELPLRTYINYIQKVMVTLQSIEPRNTFDILLGHLRNNKVASISFQLFGVAFLQLFGQVLELLNSHIMNKLLRNIFMEITVIAKNGECSLKTKGIKPINFEEVLPNFQILLSEKVQKASLIQAEKVPLSINQKTQMRETNMKSLRDRMQSHHNHNMEMRQIQGEHYPVGQRMRSRDKANISCFMMGGFEIVDYSDSINQLHRKLLTKILLNK